jgi:hypothetical protein
VEALRASGHATGREKGKSIFPLESKEKERKLRRTSVMQRFPRRSVPQQRRLTLSRDSDTLQLVLLVALFLELL